MEEQFYENLEKCIAQEATKKGEVQIERAAEIARELKAEGLKRYEFCQMFDARLNEEKMKKTINVLKRSQWFRFFRYLYFRKVLVVCVIL